MTYLFLYLLHHDDFLNDILSLVDIRRRRRKEKREKLHFKSSGVKISSRILLQLLHNLHREVGGVESEEI